MERVIGRELTTSELDKVSGGIIDDGYGTLVNVVNAIAGEIGAYTTAAACDGACLTRKLGIDPWA